ncbi:MAG: YihA family ribosome biogenesis GTP-binding protein [Firmicutes bacterium]|nr:YihA family ribosome biogenesis GTP-binding protein [Bacillota bacterium]
MKITKAELVAVAVKKEQYPPVDIPEIAFAGRSNVGKSSLFNMLVNRRNFARVSGNPGKTRTINFFEVNQTFRIVDLPGYGYAKVSKSMSKDWGPMMENYLENRENLVKVVQLVDIRHAPSAQDVQMYEYLRYHGLDGFVVATKSDKVSRNELNKNLNLIKKTLKMKPGDIIVPVSSLKKTGADQLLDEIEKLLQAKAMEENSEDAGEEPVSEE